MAAASIQRFVEDIKGSLTCSICFELFQQPKIIGDCHHTFCRDCLEQYLLKNDIRADAHDASISCPFCRRLCPVPRDGADGFRDNFNLREILTLVGDSQGTAAMISRGQPKRGCCTACKLLKLDDVSAVHYCETCHLYLCTSCHALHVQTPLSANHDISPLIGVCKRHRRPFSHFCKDCRKAVCCKCSQWHSTSQGHEAGTFDEIFHAVSATLNENVAKMRDSDMLGISKKKAERWQALKNVLEKSREFTKKELRDTYEARIEKASAVIRRIEKERDDNYSKMDETRNEMVPLELQLQELRGKLKDLQFEDQKIGRRRHGAVKDRLRLEADREKTTSSLDIFYDGETYLAYKSLEEILEGSQKVSDAFDRSQEVIAETTTKRKDGNTIVDCINSLLVTNDVTEAMIKPDEFTEVTSYEHRLERLPIFVAKSAARDSTISTDDVEDENEVGFIKFGPRFVHWFPDYVGEKPFDLAKKTVDLDLPDGIHVKQLFLLPADRVLGFCKQGDTVSILQWQPPEISVCKTINKGLEGVVDISVTEAGDIVALRTSDPHIRVLTMDGDVKRNIRVHAPIWNIYTWWEPVTHPQQIRVYKDKYYIICSGASATGVPCSHVSLVNMDGKILKKMNHFSPVVEGGITSYNIILCNDTLYIIESGSLAITHFCNQFSRVRWFYEYSRNVTKYKIRADDFEKCQQMHQTDVNNVLSSSSDGGVYYTLQDMEKRFARPSVDRLVSVFQNDYCEDSFLETALHADIDDGREIVLADSGGSALERKSNAEWIMTMSVRGNRMVTYMYDSKCQKPRLEVFLLTAA